VALEEGEGVLTQMALVELEEQEDKMEEAVAVVRQPSITKGLPVVQVA